VISKSLTKELIQELGVDGGLFVLVQTTAGLAISPKHDDLMRTVLRGVLQLNVQGRGAQESRNEERAMRADAPHGTPVVVFE
jgi:hypothetical protein